MRVGVDVGVVCYYCLVRCCGGDGADGGGEGRSGPKQKKYKVLFRKKNQWGTWGSEWALATHIYKMQDPVDFLFGYS